MSYCVNCGVELEAAARHCPLCQTKISNPKQPRDPDAVPTFPSDTYTRTERENRLLSFILYSCLFLLPMAVCLTINLVIDSELTWAAYALPGIALIWLFIFPPLIIKRHTALISLIIDTVSLLACLRLFEWLSLRGDPGMTPWFFPLAAPIVVSIAALALILMLSVQQYRTSFWNVVSLLLALISLLCIVLEIVTDLRLTGKVHLQWSLLVVAPCVVLSMLCMVVSRKRRLKNSLKNSLKKRFHV